MELSYKELVSKLSHAKIVFWDFDGVIKESVNIKADAFEILFKSYGDDISQRVKSHHNNHGGLSRFRKMPLYLNWAGEEVSEEKIQIFCNKFSELVLNSVIQSPWVPGVKEYLLKDYTKRPFVLVTATPQKEIEHILNSLEIFKCFVSVYGSPISKATAINLSLKKLKIEPLQALLIGDSKADYDAAELTSVPFLLRKTDLNLSLQRNYRGPIFNNFEENCSDHLL
jgi:phosphoglycolate phosphatase-like HAD superfamily hydrolase